MTRDYLSVDDLSPKELEDLLDLAADVKARPEAYEGRLSRVRFGGRAVCQLARLKQISAAQPGAPAPLRSAHHPGERYGFRFGLRAARL